MDTHYTCGNEGRRAEVERRGTLNGIDYLEVASVDQKKLKLHFIFALPGQDNPLPAAGAQLSADNFLIEGGERVTGIRVVDVKVKPSPSTDGILTLTTSDRGDFSTYTLRLVTSPTNLETPAGYDTQLSAVRFTFKVDCPSDFDCRVESECPPEILPEPEIDYLARDYNSFRRLMLDRLSIVMPDWRERNPADMQIALVEMLAYVGDHLSYYQDSVATEAYLGTARSRISVRRHARLLDYVMHDGCNARAWVCFDVQSPLALPSGTQLVAQGGYGEQPAPDLYPVFETMHNATLDDARNRIDFYTWSDAECCLPAGATRATLVNEPALSLKAGDVVLFEEIISPTTGLEADADPAHRHAVRLVEVTPVTDRLTGSELVEIEWAQEDALPFALCISARVEGAEGIAVANVSVVRGNVVLADHGRTITGRPLLPSQVPNTGRYRPRLQDVAITSSALYDQAASVDSSATDAIAQDVRATLPAVWLDDGIQVWKATRDLLASDRFAADFVVENERDGSARLRFGDDLLGMQPSAGISFAPSYRIGNGRQGNVGRESISRVIGDYPEVTAVRNPMSATGGADPESIDEVRQYAPQAFRTQQRAVTEADYAELAQRHPEVQKAVAMFRWTGSWYTVYIIIDRKGGRPVRTDEKFKRQIREYLERYRIAGYDLEITDPVTVPIEIELKVCVSTGYFRSDVKTRLLEIFGRTDFAGAGRGFFHPDNFTFGEPVYLSRIYQTAMGVEGVTSVEVKLFRRWGRSAGQEIAEGMLKIAPLEIVRLDNDPSVPENGRIDFIMSGGL